MHNKEISAGMSDDKFIHVPVPMISSDGSRYFIYVSLPGDYSTEDHKKLVSILSVYVTDIKKNEITIKTNKTKEFLPDFKDLSLVGTEPTIEVNTTLDATLPK